MSSLWAQLESKAPHDFALMRRMRELQRAHGDVVTKSKTTIGESARESLDRYFDEGQRRIRQGGKERDASNGFVTASSSKEEEENEESPVLPCRMHDDEPKLHHPDNSIMHCSQLDDSDVEGDGKIYVPAFGNPFVVREAPFFIPPIRPAVGTTHVVAGANEEQDKEGTMEAGAGVPKMSVCERLYKESNNSVQLLLSMCIGLVNKSEGRDRWIADLEDDPLYRDQLEKIHVPKVPMLKSEMKRRAHALGLRKFRKNSCLRPEAILWLRNNPVTDKDSVAFLLKTEAALYKTLKEAAEESQAMEREKLSQGSWNSVKPWC